MVITRILFPTWLLALLLGRAVRGPAPAALVITPFDQIDSLQAVAARPMLVFLHTDWCRYCAHMKRTTLRDPEVIRALNERFYFLSLDAETERSLTFAGRRFRFQPSGRNDGVHALAEALGTVNGRLQFPTLVFLNAAYEIELQHAGYLDAEGVKLITERFRP